MDNRQRQEPHGAGVLNKGMLNPRLILVGAQRPIVQYRLIKELGRLPKLTAYSTQSLVLGLLAEPFYWLQRLIYRAPRDMPAPIFVIGAWRSGTTFLHKELVGTLDAASARNWFTACPQAALILKPLLTRVLPSLGHRFVDWVPAASSDPQEIDIGLFRLVSELPNEKIGIGKDLGEACKTFAAWKPTREYKRAFRRMMQWSWISDRKPGQPFINKVPAHTLKIDLLLELYPNAKFVYIQRDEATNLASLTGKIPLFVKAFGVVPYEQDAAAEATVVRATMLAQYRNARHMIPAEHLVEVTYEELVADKVATVQKISERLGLH